MTFEASRRHYNRMQHTNVECARAAAEAFREMWGVFPWERPKEINVKTENEDTLRRFFDARTIHGAVNVAGVVGSLQRSTAAMLEAGWGTDQINEDPAVRYIVWGLARLSGFTINDSQWIAAHSAVNGLQSKLEKEGHKLD